MTRTRTRRAATAAATTAVLVTLAACSGGAGGGGDDADFTGTAEGEMSAWGFENADDVGQSRLDHAASVLTGVDVTLDQTAFDAQKFTTRLASGDVPDVVQMDRRYVLTYAAQGTILPLDACYSAHEVDPREQYYPFVVDDVTYSDQVWAVPQFYQPPAILLNARVMREAGVTAEEIDTSRPDVLLDAIGRMYEAGSGTPAVLGLDPVATGQGGLWILGAGGQLNDEAGRPTLDDPSNLPGLELLKQISDAQGGFAGVKSFTDAFDTFGDSNQFVTDQVGAQVAAQWYPNVLSAYVGEVELAAVPFRGTDGQPFAVASGTAFVIPAAAENPAAACDWMLNLTSTDAWMAAGEARAATRAEDGGINTGLFTGSPEADAMIRQEWVAPSGDAGFDQVISTYYDTLDYGATLGASPAGQEIQNELNNAITATLLGDKSAEEALADAQDAALRAYESMVGE